MVIEYYFTPCEVLRILGPRFKELRMRLNMTQKDVSIATGISIPTIYKFERGKLYDITMSNLYKLTCAVRMQGNWNELLPELPESPYLYKADRKRQRIRHRNESSNS